MPDLPFDESADLREALDAHGIAMVQMVTPVTKPERMKQLCEQQPGIRVRGDDDGHDRQERVASRRK